MNTKTLPYIFHRQRKFFWFLYLVVILAPPLLTAGIIVLVDSWQELIRELASSRLEEWLILPLVFLCLSVPLGLFYWLMRTVQGECMARYAKISAQEKMAIDRIFSEEIRPGDFSRVSHFRLTERHFVFNDIRRLFMRSILAYDEIIWAYITRSDYQYTDMGKGIQLPNMPYFFLVLMTRDGKKHSVFLGGWLEEEGWAEFQKRLPANVILGYGRQQKREAKEKRRWYAEYDSSIPKRQERRRNAGILFGMACVCGALAGAYAFSQSDYYDHLKMLKKADEAYAEADYFDALYYYRLAMEESPDSVQAQEGYFRAYVEMTRECVESSLPKEVTGRYQNILGWHPERSELYMEAAEAALPCGRNGMVEADHGI